MLVLLLVAGSAFAGPRHAAELGEAFRAYDRNDVAAAKRIVSQLADDAVVNRDYLAWLRGMIALRTGELDVAQRAFEALAKQRGSRLAREAPWRCPANCLPGARIRHRH